MRQVPGETWTLDSHAPTNSPHVDAITATVSGVQLSLLLRNCSPTPSLTQAADSALHSSAICQKRLNDGLLYV